MKTFFLPEPDGPRPSRHANKILVAVLIAGAIVVAFVPLGRGVVLNAVGIGLVAGLFMTMESNVTSLAAFGILMWGSQVVLEPLLVRRYGESGGSAIGIILMIASASAVMLVAQAIRRRLDGEPARE